jgi:TrmH family RNA methyltransferase
LGAWPERPRSFGPSDRGPGAGGPRAPHKGPRDFGPRQGGFEKRPPGEGFRPRTFPPAGPRIVERVAGAGDHKPVHPDIKPALPLKTDKGRWKESRFLLEGAKNIADALAISSGIIQAAYITEAFEDKDLAALLKKNRVQVVKVSSEELKVLSDAETPQPIIAVANFAALKPDWSTARYVTLCDAVQDPGNVGAILRTSLALGMDAVVLGKGCCDAYNPKVVRSSVGALLQLPFEAGEDLQAKMEFLRQKGFSIVATSSHAPITLDQAKLRKKVALIMGNEGAGTGATFLDMADAVVKIPLRKKVESLNVSVAHGILAYQLLHVRA